MIVGMSPDSVPSVDQLDSEALRTLARQLMQQLQVSESRNQQLLHELAILRRHRFGARSEQSAGVQGSLLDETIEADLADIEQQLQRQSSRTQVETRDSAPPKRQTLPPELPRIDHHHEPDTTICTCGCQLQRIGQDVTEKLDHVPSMLTVQRHIRGKWVCRQCQTLVQAPMPAQIIDKGLATSGLLAQVLVSKFADHLPLYRQEQIFMRAGVRLVRSTLAQWVGSCGAQLQPLVDALRESILAQSVLQADETPVQMLQPGSGKTHRAYLWAYTPGVYESLKAVVYDFTEGRAGAYARAFLGDWQGQLVCDDYGGYKACFEQGITEVGCMAHARRKFFELHDRGKSLIAEQALVLIGQLYGVEAQARDMTSQQRQALRQQQAQPVAAALYTWMRAHRLKVPDNTGIARALDYSIKRWQALTRYLDDGRLPIDNNHTENQIRPIRIIGSTSSCRTIGPLTLHHKTIGCSVKVCSPAAYDVSWKLHVEDTDRKKIPRIIFTLGVDLTELMYKSEGLLKQPANRTSCMREFAETPLLSLRLSASSSVLLLIMGCVIYDCAPQPVDTTD